MAKSLQIQWTPQDSLAGQTVLGDWKRGVTAHTYAENLRGLVELLAGAERLDLLQAGALSSGSISEVMAPTIGDKRAQAVSRMPGIAVFDLDSTPENFRAQTFSACAYLAALNAARRLYYGSRDVAMVEPSLALPETAEAAIPVIIALTLVGIAAVAGATWYGVDKNEKSAEVQKFAAQATAEVDAYIKDLQIRVAAGQPLPPPPKSIVTAAKAEATSRIGLIATGVVLGSVAVAGLMHFTEKTPATRTNPRRIAPRRRNTHAKPVAAARTRTAAKRRTKRNPIKAGYSRATISHNVAAQMKEGASQPQAVAISLRSARESFKARHPGKRLPAHLHTKSNPKKKTTTRTKKRAPKKNPKKKSTSKKNPKRAAAKKKKSNPRSSNSPKASFIRTQMRKGRSEKQAKADWNGKQRLRKMRRGKAKRRR